MSCNNNIFNREPLQKTETAPLPLGSVKPAGWIYDQMLIQSRGLTGHLDEFWDSVGRNSGWLGGTGENWERGPYFLDGLLPLAYLLSDKNLIEKAQPWIEWSIRNQTEDGNFGPRNNEDWWPRMVMLKVLIQYYELTNDDRVIGLMTRYFRFLVDHIEQKPLFSWGQARGGDFIYCIYWLYNRTGEAWLLEVSELLHQQTLDWSGIFTEFPFTRPSQFYYDWQHMFERYNWDEINKLMQYHLTHIVNVVMGIKEPGLYYLQSGDISHKNAVIKGIENLTKYHGHVNGMFAGDEHLSGTSPSQGHELCSVVEYLFSLQTIMDIYDDNTLLPDIMEKVAYNALPGTFTKDYWGHQYLQQPNQVLVTKGKRDWFNNNDEANLFGLEPNFGCCTANMHQGWPKFIKTLWRVTSDNGLAAVVYAPSVMNTTIGNGAEVTITEETNYPFNEIINFKISCSEKVSFPLKLRIPAWGENPKVQINGVLHEGLNAGSYYVLNRIWESGDVVVLNLPMKVRVSYWHNNSVGIEYGPLVFSLKIGEEWRKLKGNDPYADWEVYPTTPWNYALELDTEKPENSFTVVKNVLCTQPFVSENPPIVLKAKGRRLPEWQLVNNSAGDVPKSPVTSSEPTEDIELIPYGAAKLRVSQFPFIKV